ncbi:MAG: hypothetical protein ACM3YE_08850 [Bacteroidota bacterium]
MRVNKYLFVLIALGICVSFVVFYFNQTPRDNETTAKIKLLKELNFKPHKNKLTLNENLSVTEKKTETSDFIVSEISNHQQRIDEIIYEGLDFQFGETKSDIIKNLGEPLKIVEKPITSRHRLDVSDKLYDLIYDGLEARIYHVTSDEKELVLRILIENEKYKVKYGLNIGITEEYVVGILGPPSVKEKDFYEFYDSNGFAKLRFYFESNRLSKIEWNFEEN